jgi:hypothetical protein
MFEMVAQVGDGARFRLGRVTHVLLEQILAQPEQTTERPVLRLRELIAYWPLIFIAPDSPEANARLRNAEREVVVEKVGDLVED